MLRSRNWVPAILDLPISSRVRKTASLATAPSSCAYEPSDTRTVRRGVWRLPWVQRWAVHHQVAAVAVPSRVA